LFDRDQNRGRIRRTTPSQLGLAEEHKRRAGQIVEAHGELIVADQAHRNVMRAGHQQPPIGRCKDSS